MGIAEQAVQLALRLHACFETRRTGPLAQLDVPGQILLDASAELRDILSDPSTIVTASTALTRLQRRAETLLALANDHINNVDFYLVDTRWLALYTDASLLSAIIDLVMGSRGEGDAGMRARSAVRSLDMAIVVSGAIGPGRMDMIQLAIRMAQELIPPRIVSPDEQLPCGRDRTSPICAQAPRFAPTEIPVLERAPTVTAYLRTHANQPFVLRNYLTSGDHCPPWPAMASWKDPDDLLSRVGQGRHVPVEVGSAYDDDGWTQRIIDFEHFMILSGFFGDRARSVLSLEDQVPHYLAQHSLFRQFPELEDDVVLPDYVWSAPPVPSNFPSYRPPDTANGVIVNVWIGGGGGQVVSPAHTDPYYNCYAQILGQKRVWLAPPECAPHMVTHGAADTHGSSDDEDDLVGQYMGNTSSLPILRDSSNGQLICDDHPAFAQHVWPFALETVLQPGDVLVMPPGWWHAMTGEGEGPGWSVSMWY